MSAIIIATCIILIAMGACVWAVVAHYQGIRVFIEEVSFEVGKVTWPTRDDVINSTILVGITTFILTIIIMFVDKILGTFVRWLF